MSVEEQKKFNMDTVANAAATPDTELPWAELGLKQNEFEEVVKVLGRRPTAAELAMYSVMWSEHCSYKSSKNHLRQFGDKVTEEMKKDMLVGIGENAGVTNLGDGWAVTFKIESHNSPTMIEPYQGAATGIGGIVRDIISMGARPVAVMDPLRFGAIDHPDTARVIHGAVAGIGGYGNSLGLPNIGGEMVFDSVYQGNPLVNALAVGVMRHEDIRLANASGKGNKVVLFGARTGGDGIGGASILSSETFDDTKPVQAPGRPGGRPVRREGAHRVLPRAVQGFPRRGHPGPRCRRHLLRHLGACLQRRRRHGGRTDLRPAARPLADPGRNPDVRVPGTHDGRRLPGEHRSLRGDHGQVGRRVLLARRGHRHRPPDHQVGRRSHRRRRPAHRGTRRPALRPSVRPPGMAGRPAGRHLQVLGGRRQPAGHRRRAEGRPG